MIVPLFTYQEHVMAACRKQMVNLWVPLAVTAVRQSHVIN